MFWSGVLVFYLGGVELEIGKGVLLLGLVWYGRFCIYWVGGRDCGRE